MIDRPTPMELVQAVRQYLETELLPALTDPRQRFQTLVAAHVLGIVERELPREERLLAEEVRQLADMLQPSGRREVEAPDGQHASGPAGASTSTLWAAAVRANAELCEQIRAGRFDEPAAFRTLLQQLRPVVVRKLEIANPRHSGIRALEDRRGKTELR
jgi:hypothetical protein